MVDSLQSVNESLNHPFLYCKVPIPIDSHYWLHPMYS
jgi:hypothetical protein